MNKPDKTKICIIIPAYNESASISGVVKHTLKTFEHSEYSADVVVVDDGSRDDTALIARKSGGKTINHILNSGAGGATATGLRYAEKVGYNIAATMDADGQHLPEDVLRGVRLIDKVGADLLIGSRLINSQGMSRVKVMGNKGLSLLTYVLFGIKSTDSQSGLRIFSRKALEKLKWRTSGYEFCSEMLWRAKQLGLSIKEYPIEAIYTDYSVSKGQNNWNAVNIIKTLLKRRIMELFR